MTPSRRALLRAGVAFTTVLVAPKETMAQARDNAGEAAPVDGEFSRDPDVLAMAADDFGHIIHKRPWAVLKLARSADIAGLMRWAGSRGMKVAARGEGHSTYGRAMVDEGIVVDMSAMSTIHSVQPDRVVVDAGATWSSVLRATLAQGLTPPVLTNYLELSVGGTLAIGAIGGTTSRWGMQTDNVLELTVVTGDGGELTCSADLNPDLFDAVRAGLGQCGIITRATLRLIRAPERARLFHLFYSDLHALTADQRLVLMEGRFDHLQGAVLPDGAGGWKYQLEGVVFSGGAKAPADEVVLAGLSDNRAAAEIRDLTYFEHMNAFARPESLLRANGQWLHPHPWLLTFLRETNAEQVAIEILSGLTQDDVGLFGRIIYYPIFTDAVRTPLVRLPGERIVFPFNLVRMPTWSDAATAEQMVAKNRLIYDRIRSAGGVLYPVSAFPMSRSDWTQHFGPTWQLLSDAKHAYDPNGILTPGYELF